MPMVADFFHITERALGSANVVIIIEWVRLKSHILFARVSSLVARVPGILDSAPSKSFTRLVWTTRFCRSHSSWSVFCR